MAIFKETNKNQAKSKFKINTETIKIEILENYEKDMLNKIIDLMVVMMKC